MFSTSAPSTAESNFITRNVDMDMDLDAGTGTLFGPSEDMTLNISAGLGAEDGVALGDLVMEPWQIGPWVSEASTNISMSTPTSGYAPKSGHERHVSDGSQCQCLRRIVILVDEIVSIVDRDGLQSLDSALAAQKEALGCGARMLECLDCTRRVENMIILALMVDKLVRMCTHVSEACCAGLRAIGGKSSTDKHKIVGMAPLLSLQCHTNTNRQGPAHQELDRGANPTTRVYSVDSSDEYFFVMAGILRFQLLELSNLSRQLGRAAAPLASDTISQRLAACNEVVDDMLNKAGLASSEASKGEDVEAIQTA
jgi:hypothetical protein